VCVNVCVGMCVCACVLCMYAQDILQGRHMNVIRRPMNVTLSTRSIPNFLKRSSVRSEKNHIRSENNPIYFYTLNPKPLNLSNSS